MKRRSRSTLFASVAIMLALPGCEYLRVVSFQAAEGSGITGRQAIQTALVAPADPAVAQRPDLGDGFDSRFETALEAHCSTSDRTPDDGAFTPEALPALVLAPLAGALVQITIDQVTSELQAAADELRARSQQTYDGRLILETDTVAFGRGPQCLVFVRRVEPAEGASEDDGLQPGFALIMTVEPKGASATAGGAAANAPAVVLRPVYLELKRALAVTGQGEGLDIAVAVAARAALRDAKGPAVRDVSLGSFTVPAVPPGSVMDAFEDDLGTGLVALYPDETRAIELTLAVTETGSAIPDTERAKAEVEAISKAVGPALKKFVEDRIGAL